MEESIQGNGRTGAVMAKDSSNKKVGRCILEDSKMQRDMGEASYMSRTGSISPFTKMDVC